MARRDALELRRPWGVARWGIAVLDCGRFMNGRQRIATRYFASNALGFREASWPISEGACSRLSCSSAFARNYNASRTSSSSVGASSYRIPVLLTRRDAPRFSVSACQSLSAIDCEFSTVSTAP